MRRNHVLISLRRRGFSACSGGFLWNDLILPPQKKNLRYICHVAEDCVNGRLFDEAP